MWNCVCECGNTTTVRAKSLTCGVTKSCGCFAKEHMASIAKKHGGYGTRLYAIWNSMRQRCLNKNNHAYGNYGGRGITICSEWDDFSKFKDWAYRNGYDDHAGRGECTLDRIDVNKGYYPGNCRWATAKEQSLNRRDTILVEYNGEQHSLKEWSQIIGIRYDTMWRRYKKGKSIQEVFAPVLKK